MTLKQFSIIVDLPYKLVRQRFSCGWSLFDIANRRPNGHRHNMTGTRLYRIYVDMIARCTYKCNNRYKNYGARGIKVCDEWLNDRKTFFDWAMNNGYQENLTIDRIDVNGNYEPNNCRWVTNYEQCQNKTTTIKLEYNGQTKSISDWAKEYNLTPTTIYKRIHDRGWSVDDALLTPYNKRDRCSEKAIENKLRQWLAKNGIYTLGIVKQKKTVPDIGYHQKVFNGGYMSTPGIPDLSITIHGIDIQIECKKEDGLPSIQQKRILEQILNSGGYGFILKPSNYDLIIQFLSAIIYHDNYTRDALYEILLQQTFEMIDGKTRR